jgi:general secretion pathway protein F
MPRFRYQALNTSRQSVAGDLEADTVQQAITQLEAAGLTVQSIGYAPLESTPVAGEGNTERVVLESHMAGVLEQAPAISPALAAYADEMPSGRRRRELQTVCRVLDGGDAAEATRALESLPEYWIPLLSSAASSHDPGHVLQEYLAESHRADELRRQRWVMLAYPTVVIGIAAIVLTVISCLVTPAFAEMFSDFDLELPDLTLVVLAVSHWITWGGVPVIAAVVAVLGLLLFCWLALTRYVTFAMPWGRSTAIARFAQFAADLLEAGVDIPNALRVAGFTTRKPRLRRAAWLLANDLERGSGPVMAGLLTEPPDDRESPEVRGQETRAQQGQETRAQHRAYRPLTTTVLHALRADMAASSRIRLLREISDCYAGRDRTRLSWAYGIIEPIAILAVGALVAIVVLALFLPLVSLIQNLSG